MVCRGFDDPVEGGLSAGDFVENLVGGAGPDESSGLSLQAETQQSIRISRSATEVKLVLVKALRLRTEDQHSTRLSHDELVGVKWRCQRRRFASCGLASHGPAGLDRLSKMMCSFRSGSTCMSILRKNASTSRPVWERRVSCSTSPEPTFSPANRCRFSCSRGS